MGIYQVEIIYEAEEEAWMKFFFTKKDAYAFAKKQNMMREENHIKEIGILEATSKDDFDNSAKWQYLEWDYKNEK